MALWHHESTLEEPPYEGFLVHKFSSKGQYILFFEVFQKLLYTLIYPPKHSMEDFMVNFF